MELWVRNQNKQRLSKVDDIYYVADGDFWAIRINRSALDYAGLYPTEERCLEIIDEIQDLLVKSNPKEAFLVLNNIGCADYEELEWKVARARKYNFIPIHDGDVQVVQPSVLVYEMPKE